MERKLELAEGTLLETPWRDLPKKQRDIWLWGTGDEHITFTWRAGKAAQKYGGTFDGLIPELLEKYRTSKSPPQIRQLEQYMSVIRCPDCHGPAAQPAGLRGDGHDGQPAVRRSAARATLPEVCALAVSDAAEFFAELELEGNEKLIAAEVLKEIRGRLGFLQNVGLEYLTLERTAPTLSGGESQRIRLAGQIGCGLVGVLYILDEPSIGLHPRDNQRLLDTLAELARPGQHGRRRRARRRHDAGGRPPHRLRPRPGRARRRSRGDRHGGGDCPRAAKRDGGVSVGQAED